LSIREWEVEDIPSIQHIAWTTWLASYGSFIPERDMRTFFEEYYTTEALTHFCQERFAKGFIAECETTPAGFAKTNFSTNEKKFYLNSLYILPEYQGKGIGSQLLQVCEDFALSLNADEIWLGVMAQNVSALEWYKKIGFQFVREEPFTMGKTTVQHLIGFRRIPNSVHKA
jgi:ribosomal protein S18 acetylase RimI-like enzyme